MLGQIKMSALQPFLIPAFVLSWVVGLVWVLTYTRQLKRRYPQLHADIFRDSFQKKAWNDMRLFVFLMTAKYSGAVAQDFKKQSDFLRLHIFASLTLLFLTAITIIFP